MHLKTSEAPPKTIYQVDKTMHQLRAIGYVAEIFSVLFALAWAFPLFLFNTFDKQPAYYASMLEIMPDYMWALCAFCCSLVVGGSHIVGIGHRKSGMVMRALGTAGIAVFFGIMAWIELLNNHHMPSPYLHLVMSSLALLGSSLALADTREVVNEGEAFAIIVPKKGSSE